MKDKTQPVTTSAQFNLSNHFLIALPSMDDPNFYQTVTYICEHNASGALGIVINRPTTIKLAEVLQQMDIVITNPNLNESPILYGGPIHQERGFVIHRPFGVWRSSFATAEDIAVTTSRDILEAIASDEGPQKMMIALGFAGWEAGQLESELTNKNIWLSCPADSNLLFDTPFEQRWQAAGALLGINLNEISRDAGHA